MSSGDRQIETDELLIGYAGQALCEPISFSVQTGAGLGIIGANGSGKSSLIRTVLGLQPAVSGTVIYCGSPLDEGSARFRQEVAVQVTDGVFFEELTVAEHLEMVARGHRIKAWQAAVDNELEFFQLTEVTQRLPQELSSGQRRKLLLAAALIRPASLLILDEPEQRLDQRIRTKLYRRLRQLRAKQVTLLVVTHDPQLIRECLDEVVLLDGDQVQTIDAQSGALWLER
ncbi:ATP-binding cassette domain-containing protein [Glutamicibacter bergerei]|jgi:ABC-type multidrug transport system ATPase subunit|uniref:ATP-binding cassette domain-containing protein n=1 Tax=Glutamicibacter bergerei TaxID=256702 RepID=A0ABV9MM65_9MICC|nr:ABC transporter ATP-binding protein [Micrococcaceae bacterium]